MGRRPDNPDVQAAKGFPGRRKSKVEKRMEELAKVAHLLAAAPTSDGDAPALLTTPEFAPTLAIWKRLAPELVRTNRLPSESRDFFAALCVYTAAYWSYAQDIALNGEFQRVKRTNGSWEEKCRPSVSLRDAAFDNMLKLAPKFGMTPLDMYALYKDQASAAHSNPGLFPARDGASPPPAAAEPDETLAVPGGLLGAAARLRSEPPAGRA